jgi:hypothetical protein
MPSTLKPQVFHPLFTILNTLKRYTKRYQTDIKKYCKKHQKKIGMWKKARIFVPS